VAGITQDDKALVVSQGNPDGLIARQAWKRYQMNRLRLIHRLPSKATVNAPNRATRHPWRSVSQADQHGGSIGLGGAQIFVSQNGQVSGS
jgi:hypothetical protein